MPCLNARATIARSLGSIFSQDTDGVEVLVVDGGSRDGTVDLLRGEPRVRWTSEPDDGLSDAYNKGAQRAQGDVLGWLNADDAYLPGTLQTVRHAFAEDPELVWLTGQCLIVDASGTEIRQPVTRYKNALLRRYSHRLHLTQNFVSAPSTFFRRDAFLDSGGFDTSLRYSMDYDLYLRLGRASRPRILHEPLAAFTMDGASLSMTGFEKQFVEHQAVARRYRSGAPVAYAVNTATSRGIVLVYRAMRWARSAAPARG